MAQRTESFVRWQSVTIEQLGYSAGLILGLAAASLGFALNIVKDPIYDPGCWCKALMLASLISLILSLAFGVWCVINRLLDFRKTSGVARDRERWNFAPDEIKRRLDALARRNKTEGSNNLDPLPLADWRLCPRHLPTDQLLRYCLPLKALLKVKDYGKDHRRLDHQVRGALHRDSDRAFVLGDQGQRKVRLSRATSHR